MFERLYRWTCFWLEKLQADGRPLELPHDTLG